MIMTENPLKKAGWYRTPDSVAELTRYLQTFSGSEGVIASTCAMMAWNLASKIIDEALNEKG
jgi:hypothetical protein